MPNYNRPDADCEDFLRRKLLHYHVIHLNERVKTPGSTDRNGDLAYVGLRDADFQGRRVLDVGANDGVLSFLAERAGAAEVLAIDVEDPRLQDWGWAGPPADIKATDNKKRVVFDELKEFFDSNVVRKQMTVYDLSPESDGMFDIIFFYGVLYHLRHPLLAFDRLRAVCRQAILVETHVCNHEPLTPSTLFYYDDVLDNAASNWTGPSESCVALWMLDAGFNTVFAEIKPIRRTRQRFIGFVDQPTFEVNEKKFRHLGEPYFRRVRSECRRKIELGLLWRF